MTALRTYPNTVQSVSKPATLLMLLPESQAGWCEQFAQEGYNVVHVFYPAEHTSKAFEAAQTQILSLGADWALISYGLLPKDASSLVSRSALSMADLKACIHFCPASESPKGFLVHDEAKQYIPTTFHLAASQEALHASLLPFTDARNLGYAVPTRAHLPIHVYAYPLVQPEPPFPFLVLPYVLLTQSGMKALDGSSGYHARSATDTSYSRTLQLLKRTLGPHFDLEKLWDQHTYFEFADRDATKTMATMVPSPYVNHVAAMTGGVGFHDLSRFYKVTPPDTELISVSRTVGSDKVVEEMIFKCTHTTEIQYFLPGVAPTGKPIEIALVAVVAFRGDKLFFEHIYWDQASLLVQVRHTPLAVLLSDETGQIGLLDPSNLPVAGIEVARKVMDPFGQPSNTLLAKWKESEGKSARQPELKRGARAAKGNLAFARNIDCCCSVLASLLPAVFHRKHAHLTGAEAVCPFPANPLDCAPKRPPINICPLSARTMVILMPEYNDSKSPADGPAHDPFDQPTGSVARDPFDSYGAAPEYERFTPPAGDAYGAHDASGSTLAYAEADAGKHYASESAEEPQGYGAPPARGDLEYAEPEEFPGAVEEKTGLAGMFAGGGRYPLQQRIEDKKRGIGRQRYPVVVWTLTVAMVAVFIYELVVQQKAQGTPVSFHPVVNPMLGPSEAALIELGARFPPCMKSVVGVPTSTEFACPSDTANPPDILCSLETICAFGGFHGDTPNQWFRFITPIFLHAGFVHILLNMLAQLTASAQIEKEMGSGGFLLTYFAAGVFGNVLGANFALVGAPSLGASGAIFGTVAVTWVDLFAHWKYQYRPVRKLIFMSAELIIGIAMGYIPYVDNFAHLGGFLMGLLVGTTFYPVISTTRRHKGVMWAFRLAALPAAVVLFVVLIRNFYTADPPAALPDILLHAAARAWTRCASTNSPPVPYVSPSPRPAACSPPASRARRSMPATTVIPSHPDHLVPADFAPHPDPARASPADTPHPWDPHIRLTPIAPAPTPAIRPTPGVPRAHTPAQLTHNLRALAAAHAPLPALLAHHAHHQHAALRSRASFALLAALALRHGATRVAHGVLREMGRAVGADARAWALWVRAMVRQGRWDAAWGAVHAILGDGGWEEPGMPLDVWLEFLAPPPRLLQPVSVAPTDHDPDDPTHREPRKDTHHQTPDHTATPRRLALLAGTPPALAPGRRLPPRAVHLVVHALLRAHDAPRARALTHAALPALPPRAALALVHLHIALGHTSGSALGRHQKAAREADQLLSLAGIKPTAETLFLLLAPLKHTTRAGTHARRAADAFAARWGPGVESARVRRRIAAFAVKEGNVKLAEAELGKEAAARWRAGTYAVQEDVLGGAWGDVERGVYPHKGLERKRWLTVERGVERRKEKAKARREEGSH
ncbi:hypothetical protein HWV62_40995 [Athelia sp. TMB]|nr:hypothetical protein HWV62_40995 [Athelia sp. TMB]